MIIKAKIDVTKIDKARLYKGTKGTYLDATLLENRDGVDQYGNDGMIVQDVSKADREAGVKGAIIGNWKRLEQRQAASAPKPAPNPTTATTEGDDEIPF